ncbi:MAG: hypothetical protein Q7S00_02950, partial [bacterium]|nr:hypothetical protein [bacterium]
MAPPSLPILSFFLAQPPEPPPPQKGEIEEEKKFVSPPAEPVRYFVPGTALPNFMGSAASLGGLTVVGSHRFHHVFANRWGPTNPLASRLAWAQSETALKVGGIFGLLGIGALATSSGYQMLYNHRHPGVDPYYDQEMHLMILASAATAGASIGFGLLRQRALVPLAEKGIAFYRGAPLAEKELTRRINAYTWAQNTTAVANVGIDTWGIGHQIHTWEQNPDPAVTAQLAFQMALVPLFSLDKRTRELLGDLFTPRGRRSDIEMLGARIAERMAASGIAGIEKVQNPYYLAAILLAREGLPEHFTYRMAERSMGRVGDFEAQMVAESVLNTRVGDEPILGLAHDPQRLTPEELAELLPAVLKEMGVRVYQKDLTMAQKRVMAGRIVRLEAEGFSNLRNVPMRIGQEVEVALPNSRLPGQEDKLMGMDEALDLIEARLRANGWAEAGWTFTR